MKTIEIKVYEFDELSDSAKEKAREWYREGALDYDWWDSTYDDAENIGLKLTSFDLDRNRHACGKFTLDAETVAKRVISDHGKDCETFKTATAFLKERGEVSGSDGERDDKLESIDDEFERSLIEDYSIILQNEYEYLLSDEQVDESIKSNEYTFTESGKCYR